MIAQASEYKLAAKFDIGEEPGEWLENVDPAKHFISSVSITFYGIPAFLSAEQDAALDEEDFSKFDEVCKIRGWYISMMGIADMGYDPASVCDGETADLGHISYKIMSLYEESDELDFPPDVFYMEDLDIPKNDGVQALIAQILAEIPAVLEYELHLFLDVLAFFPAPTGHEEKVMTPKEKALEQQAIEKLNRYFSSRGKVEDSSTDESNLVEFPKYYENSAEEVAEDIEELMNQPAYPDKFINQPAFDFLIGQDFFEVGNSRVLIKILEP